jgi:hypothetical protein
MDLRENLLLIKSEGTEKWLETQAKNGDAHPAESQSAKKKNATNAVHCYAKVPIKRLELLVREPSG